MADENNKNGNQQPKLSGENIQVGAGLQDDRINQDFADFLNKWGMPALTVIAVLAAIYVGVQKLGEWQAAKLDGAFVAFEEARGSVGTDGIRTGSPDSLLAVAEEHAGHGAIAVMAKLDAADIYAGAARRGLAPGADLTNQVEADILDETETSDLLAKADALYEEVASKTSGDRDRTMLNIRALFGRAAVAMSRYDSDAARTHLEAAAAVSEERGYLPQAEEARARIEILPEVSTPIQLIAQADLPPERPLDDPFASPGTSTPADPATLPLNPDNPNSTDPFVDQIGPNNYLVQPQPEGFVPPGFDPDQVPIDIQERLRQEQERQQQEGQEPAQADDDPFAEPDAEGGEAEDTTGEGESEEDTEPSDPQGGN